MSHRAVEEAAKFTKQQKLIEKQREEDERKLFGAPEETNNEIIRSAEPKDLPKLRIKEGIREVLKQSGSAKPD